jgi:hypothetical protein
MKKNTRRIIFENARFELKHAKEHITIEATVYLVVTFHLSSQPYSKQSHNSHSWHTRHQLILDPNIETLAIEVQGELHVAQIPDTYTPNPCSFPNSST